ncbi:helix-turn-helix domain-containing protein [Dyadobacter sp. CY351]|nr:helix-turn-helix domain-containing protein [Dyadobacter sp. CY351]
MGRNRKHSAEFRLGLIKAYLRGNSINGLARKHGIVSSLLRKWINHYEKSGSLGLLPQYNQVYSSDFKHEAVLAYRTKSLSLAECCLKYGIPSQSTLLGWSRQFERAGINGFNNARGRPSKMTKKTTFKRTYGPLTRLEELERENLYLRAENELLKKLEALAQQEQQEAVQRRKR